MTMRCQKLIYGLRAKRCAAGGTQPNCVGTKIHWKIVKQTISKAKTATAKTTLKIIIKDGRRWHWRGDVRKDLWQQIICERELHKYVEPDDDDGDGDVTQQSRKRLQPGLENKQSRLFLLIYHWTASNKKWH